MTRKRAFTMVEMMLVVALTAVIMGTVTAVYAYTVERLGYGLADASTQVEAEYGLDIIDSTINKAQSCSQVSVSGNPCLKCTMPANCSDTTGDGILDTCTPNAINRRSQERWGNGYRIWFYLADASGLPSNPGSIPWMAKRLDDLTPTASDQVKAFTYFPGNTNLRLDLLQSAATAPAGTSNTYSVSLNVGAYGGLSQQAAPATANTTSSYQFNLGRVPYMRGWRF